MENEFQKSITERGINICTKVKFEKKDSPIHEDQYLTNIY